MSPTKPYSPYILYVLMSLYFLCWLLILFDPGNKTNYPFAFCLCLGIVGSILLLDPKGFLTLQGILGPDRDVIGCILLMCCFFPFWLNVYLVATLLAYHRFPLAMAPTEQFGILSVIGGMAFSCLLYVAFANISLSSAPVPTAMTPTVTATLPISTSTAKPPPKSQPTSFPPATQAPASKQTPTKTGLGGNPYGYDLNAPGTLIYHPPSDLCHYIPCIANFDKGSGYVEECQDGQFSKRGGLQGSCSQHGGDKQPLYAH